MAYMRVDTSPQQVGLWRCEKNNFDGDVLFNLRASASDELQLILPYHEAQKYLQFPRVSQQPSRALIIRTSTPHT